MTATAHIAQRRDEHEYEPFLTRINAHFRQLPPDEHLFTTASP